MRHRALFSGLAFLVFLSGAGSAQSGDVTREGDLWVKTFRLTAPARPRVRINAHGTVDLHGGATTQNFEYQVKVGIRARNEVMARMLLERLRPRPEVQAEFFVLTTPGDQAVSSVVMLAPRLLEAQISTSDGEVKAEGIDGSLQVDTGADDIKVDRVKGNCTLATGGGLIEVGSVEGFLHSTTQAGAIRVQSVGGESFLRTNGGDIEAQTLKGKAHVESGGGTVRVHYAGGPVTAINGGGPIIVDHANGLVNAQSMAGPVRVGGAAGIRCESANGYITLANINGNMNVVTTMGNIMANLLGSRLAQSTLATGNGDITVVIPSNVGVNIRAQNQLTDSPRRITSEYRDIQPRLRGAYLIAEGKINGGGPLLEISARSGTITLKRQ